MTVVGGTVELPVQYIASYGPVRPSLRVCWQLHTKYRTHCMPLYGTLETVALCRGVETKVIIYGNRGEAELDSKCSARLSLHAYCTYFGVGQPLLPSFADPKKGQYPVVDV